MLRFLDAGESHGKCLFGIIEGFPGGFTCNTKMLNHELKKRQGGYGRGSRMDIEQDQIQILSGTILGKTIGSPIGLMIKNTDYKNFNKDNLDGLTIPRPGHADLPGALKFGLKDYRPILERASARKTAMRVAIGSLAHQLLNYFSIYSYSHVIRIGEVSIQDHSAKNSIYRKEDINRIKSSIDESPVYCLDVKISKLMIEEIDKAKKEGDSLGGVFEVVVCNVPIGLGSHVFWERRIDSRIAGALMSIPSVKAVEVGEGIQGSKSKGSQFQDAIYYQYANSIKTNRAYYYRKKNWAGGIEGGITNGENIILHVYIKPIPTLLKSLPSVDMNSKKEMRADYQRSDICVVPAASVVGEAVVNWEVASAFLEKFGGDSIEEIKSNYKHYLRRLRSC